MRRNLTYLAYRIFSREHRTKLHNTNPIERFTGHIKRRTEVVGFFPNDDTVVRLVGAILPEQTEECAVECTRNVTLETIAQMSDDLPISLKIMAC